MASVPTASAETTAVYGLTSKARCVAPQYGERNDRSRFLLGTLNLREDNEVVLIEVDEENPTTPSVQEVASFPHPGEIWSLSPSPDDPSLLFTAYDTDTVPKCTLWKMDEDASRMSDQAHFAIKDGASPVVSVLWSPLKPGTLCVVDGQNLHQCTIVPGSSEIKEIGAPALSKPDARFCAARWSPLQESIVATASEKTVAGWDLRKASSSGPAWCIERAHADHVRDLDLNPNSINYVATGGDDGRVRFWDVRKTQKPVRTMPTGAHQHWVWKVLYHPHHDELLISSSSDGRVVLWNVASISESAEAEAMRSVTPSGVGEVAPMSVSSPAPGRDGPVKIYEEHDDSVYGLAWGVSPSSSVWSFISLSYAGRAVINYVPPELSDLSRY